MVDEVSSVSQQTAAEATSVSAASEEQASSLTEATTNIEQLSQLAEELHDNVADFEVGGNGSSGRATDDEPAAEWVDGSSHRQTGTNGSNGSQKATREPDVVDPDTGLSVRGDGLGDEDGNGAATDGEDTDHHTGMNQ